MRRILTFVCAAAMCAAVAAQTPKSPQKPGKWKVTMETEMPGMPMKVPPVTTDVCITEADLAVPEKTVQNDPKSKCTVSDYKVTGNTVSWKMNCPEQQMSGVGEMTYQADTYSGTLKMKMGAQEITQKHSGKWIGATCTK